uniref:AlNc14C134G7048 protein n=1 Tax=Albugo laibachii Nc14 TaxID=890382 RepID=F0WKJ6_9STRA|nr:AlNc14C134G7048 [Albugo laibachii Nc14]|eukprot:CCA21802.1 AlNc14C134G7048 [Albugo laibachii Nc14]
MEPRPFGESLQHATRPNELIHFDYLAMPASEDNYRYILILKDDMSGYVELILCSTASADNVQRALLEWFKRPGIVKTWVSDRGSHFKHQFIEKMKLFMGSQHHFPTAYRLWATGTVDVVTE